MHLLFRSNSYVAKMNRKARGKKSRRRRGGRKNNEDAAKDLPEDGTRKETNSDKVASDETQPGI